MTTEQKAKAYDEALEMAKNVLETDLHESGVWAIKKIFPELEESEDEKMLRTIIRGFENWKSNGMETFNNTKVDDILAYLEKQKINTEGDFGRGYNCGYEACLHSHGAEWFEKQKEQTTLEYLPKEKVYDIMSKLTSLSFSPFFPIKSEEYKKIDEITSDVRDLLNYPIKQKPEWSVKDEIRRDGIIQWLREYQKKFNPEYDSLSIESIESLIDWFKSLQLQPKNEWSEDDKFKLEDAITGIDAGIGFYETEGKHPNLLKAIIEAKEWLKSLCPQPKQECSDEEKRR